MPITRRSPSQDESWRAKSFASAPQDRKARITRRSSASETKEAEPAPKKRRRFPRREAITEAIAEYRGHPRTKDDKVRTKDAIVLIAEAKKEGRPPDYNEAFCDLVFKISLLGVKTKEDLATLLEVPIQTINDWCNKHHEFSAAIMRGGAYADAQTVHSLYKRANGFEREAVKVFQFEGTPVYAPYTEYYPPDVGAAIKLLVNRQPDRWRDRRTDDAPGGMRMAFEMGAAIGEIRRTIIDARYEDVTPADQPATAGRVVGPQDAPSVQTAHIARSEV